MDGGRRKERILGRVKTEVDEKVEEEEWPTITRLAARIAVLLARRACPQRKEIQVHPKDISAYLVDDHSVSGQKISCIAL